MNSIFMTFSSFRKAIGCDLVLLTDEETFNFYKHFQISLSNFPQIDITWTSHPPLPEFMFFYFNLKAKRFKGLKTSTYFSARGSAKNSLKMKQSYS